MIARHKVIDDFLPEKLARAVAADFPDVSSAWHTYNNPLEVKFAMDNVEAMSPCIRETFYLLQTEEFVRGVSRDMEIVGLETDPYLHGAGLHCMPPGGKLDMHLDYSIHPYSGKERRVNLILFLNADWKPEWGGELVLYPADPHDGSMSDSIPPIKILPRFNRAVIFETSDISWHGVPFVSTDADPRRTLAIYYVSPPTGNQRVRFKAQYARMPGQQDPYDRLRAIRAHRRLTAEDFQF